MHHYSIPPTNRHQAIENLGIIIGGFEQGKMLKVTVQLAKQDRTTKQNSALWGVAYPAFRELGFEGDNDMKQLHEYFCCEYFGRKETKIRGVEIPIRTTTTDEEGKWNPLSVEEMADFYRFVQRGGTELGVFVPDPDPNK